MPSVRYIIELSSSDRKILQDIVSKGTSPAKAILRANILLASDRNNKKHMTVAEIAETYHTTPTTVQNVRTSYANSGLDATISRKKRETPPVPPKITGDIEAHIIALACGDPPEGYSKWTLRLLADKCVELNYAESLSHMTVARILKKRIQASPEKVLVHPSRPECSIRRCNGRCFIGLRPSFRRELPGDLHGRKAGSAVCECQEKPQIKGWPDRIRGQRVHSEWNCLHLSVHGTTQWMALC